MTISKLKDWLFDKELADQWWVSLDGITEPDTHTLDETAVMIRSGQYGVSKVLHTTKAEEPNPIWVDLELDAIPQSPVHQQAYAQPNQMQQTSAAIQQGFHNTVATTEKNPGLAAVLSFLFPGLGQIYNGQVGMGILLFVLTIALYMTVILGLILHLYLVFDAYKSAEKFNKNR